mgnify:CR=1 FL=1
MAITQDVVAVNVFSGAKLERRERTTSTSVGPDGKPGAAVRYGMTIEAKPILFDFSIESLTKQTGEAILKALRDAVEAIGAAVSPSTLGRRDAAARGLSAGVASYVARYSGGRTTNDPPGTKRTFWNDSGRFVKSLFVMVNKKENGITINVAANRLNPDKSVWGGGEAALIAAWRRLLELAPAFKGGQDLLQVAAVRSAIEGDIAGSIYVMKREAAAKLSGAQWQLARAVARDALKILTLV